MCEIVRDNNSRNVHGVNLSPHRPKWRLPPPSPETPEWRLAPPSPERTLPGNRLFVAADYVVGEAGGAAEVHDVAAELLADALHGNR